MDEHYASFLNDFNPTTDRQKAPRSSIDQHEKKLPAQLLEYWKEYGWCGYADGIFWTVNPQEYETLLSHWLSETNLPRNDNYYVITRSAFGIFLYGVKSKAIV
ncbi:hypothetical protein ALP45_01127 [Pseudomonas coronafaciens pv. atropurpurea]|nr:Uncharacterized protein ALO66_01257 [Pseudomonas coronafaciens pv. atropurpurea]RMT54718.1 hypothetical protein ALP45_01127 [Pseudomonas coronafaciens pv. atropurpurea]